MISILLIWAACFIINVMMINITSVVCDKASGIGLFDWDDDLWFIPVLGPIGSLLFLITMVTMLIGESLKWVVSKFSCPEWLRKFNPKIS